MSIKRFEDLVANLEMIKREISILKDREINELLSEYNKGKIKEDDIVVRLHSIAENESDFCNLLEKTIEKSKTLLINIPKIKEKYAMFLYKRKDNFMKVTKIFGERIALFKKIGDLKTAKKIEEDKIKAEAACNKFNEKIEYLLER